MKARPLKSLGLIAIVLVSGSMSACRAGAERDADACSSFGYPVGSLEYAQCRERAAYARRQARAEALDDISAAGFEMQRQAAERQRRSQPTTCVSRPEFGGYRTVCN